LPLLSVRGIGIKMLELKLHTMSGIRTKIEIKTFSGIDITTL